MMKLLRYKPKLRHLKNIAAYRLARHFMKAPFELSFISENCDNRVYLAKSQNSKLVIRVANLGHYKALKQAETASNLAKAAGVPTPDIIATGRRLVPFAFQVSRYVEGISGDHYKGDKLAVWYQIGQQARKINRVRTTGYDYDLFPPKQLQTPWQGYILRKIIEVVGFFEGYKLRPLDRQVLFTEDQLRLLKDYLDVLPRVRFDPCLIHVDLALRNVVVNDQGKVVAILDWDNAKSYPQPHQIATTTFWLKPAEAEAFMLGYGQRFDPDIIKAFQVYEYLTQIPYHPLDTALSAKRILLWLAGSEERPSQRSAWAAPPLPVKNTPLQA